jgi:hypothetical protein
MPGRAEDACGVGSAVIAEQPTLDVGVTGTNAGVFVSTGVAVADVEEQDVNISKKKSEIKESRNVFIRMRTSLYHVIASTFMLAISLNLFSHCFLQITE